MTPSELTKAMADAGAPIDAILIALRAVEEARYEAEAHRAAARDRKRRQRDKSRDSHVTVPGHDTGQVTPDPLPLPPSPQTPQPPTPSPGVGSTRARGGPAEGFDSFWSAYPRKVGKPKALLAYRAALRRCGGPDPPAEVLAGLQAHLPGWELTEPDLVPHPTTWLNRDGWNDQPTRPQPRLIHDRPGPHPPRSADAAALGGGSRTDARRAGAALALELRGLSGGG